LIISTSTAVRQSKITALARNKFICELADKALIVTANDKSSLTSLSNEFKSKTIAI